MHLKRLRTLFSSTRLRHCRRLFQRPMRAWLSLSFCRRGGVTVTLKNGRSLSFSRDRRDHHLWDWLLAQQEDLAVEFTPDGCVEIAWQGQTFHLRPGTLDAFVLKEIYVDDVYGLLAMPSQLGTVIDLGANAGLFTCAVLPRASKVIAVEAVSQNHEQACRNIVLNGGNSADVLRLAVAGDSSQPIRIYHSSRNSGGHSMVSSAQDESTSFEEVPTITLTELLHEYGCQQVDLLKCDIEGAEYDVFLNTPCETLQNIRQICMEVHFSADLPTQRLSQLTAHLKAAGFEVKIDRPPPAVVSGWHVRTLTAAQSLPAANQRAAA